MMYRSVDPGSVSDKAWSLGPLLFWGVFFLYSFHAALPANPIRLPFAEAVDIRTMAPQGWAFFTRDPREADIDVRAAEAAWTSLLHPNNSTFSLLGASRDARAQRIELGMLSTRIPSAKWVRCKGDPAICLEESRVVLHLENDYPIPTLCGDLGFVKAPPVPWAWSGTERSIHMPSKISRVTVSC